MTPTHHLVCIAPRLVPPARFDQCFDQRTVEIRAHHSHSFAVAPIEFAGRFLEMDLLRRKSDALWDDEPTIAAVEISALDGAVICRSVGDTHITPVDVTCFDIDNDAVGKMATRDDSLFVGSIRDPSNE